MIKTVLKNAVLGSQLLNPLLKGKRFVFCYHDISTINDLHHAPKNYSTKPDVFKEHIDFLASNFELVSMDEIIKEDLPKNKTYVSISFDDGFKSVYDIAYPYLQKRNIPFSIFLNQNALENNQLWVTNLVLEKTNTTYLKQVYNSLFTSITSFDEFCKQPLDYIFKCDFKDSTKQILHSEEDNTNRIYMNLKEAAELKEAGVLIGNHTCHHYNLSKCNHTLQTHEIIENKNYLEEKLGIEINHFAIPFGKKEHYNEETIEISQKSGHQYLLTSNVNDYKPKRDGNTIPRIVLTNESIKELTFYMNRTIFKNYNL